MLCKERFERFERFTEKVENKGKVKMSTIETTITENIISYLQACNVSIKNFKRFLESETPSFDFNSASDLEYAMANSPSIMIRVLTGQLSKPDAKRMLMPVMPVELQELLSQVTKELEKEDSEKASLEKAEKAEKYLERQKK